MPDSATVIYRRRVFFISGFDPRGAAFMHGTCERETAKWGNLTGYKIETSTRERDRNGITHNWTVSADLPGGRVETKFSFLKWDDIIRSHWPKGEAAAALRTFVLLLRLMLSGVYGRALRQSWPFAVTMTSAAGWVLIPIVMLLLSCLAVALFVVLPIWAGWAAALFCVGIAVWLLWWGVNNVQRTKPGWTGRIGLFSRAFALGEVEGLDKRLQTFVDHIVETIERDEANEVLIVGHSFGTLLATLVSARILERWPELGEAGGKLALITLGQIQSLALHMREARWFRDELAHLAEFRGFTWLDFSSPLDGACYALVNVLDFLPAPHPKGFPRLLNAQFHKTFSAKTIEDACRHPMEMHFLYLKSPDVPQLDTDVYDFIALIAGPLGATQRFARRKSGKAFFG